MKRVIPAKAVKHFPPHSEQDSHPPNNEHPQIVAMGKARVKKIAEYGYSPNTVSDY